MSLSKSSKKWLDRQKKDPFVRQAKEAGYRSRAAFKLIEIQEKYQIIQPGMRVLELGCAPGSWTELIAEWTGAEGQVYAIDLLETAPIGNVEIRQGNMESKESDQWYHSIAANGLDLVLSDIAPNMCGHQRTDQLRSAHLVEVAVDISRNYLQDHGSLLVKAFHGSGFNDILKTLRSTYKRVKVVKPDASRRESGEIYLLCLDKMPHTEATGDPLS
ncbi:MAG: 23S rRNA methyltransferase [Legionellales bacterium]|nr:23S rRNA methyltransferase [Legionellales bacterium]HAV93321.1 23S rRNA methyltransferase [Pseudomonadota bacterium]